MAWVILIALGVQVIHGFITWYYRRERNSAINSLEDIKGKIEQLNLELVVSRKTIENLQLKTTDLELRGEARVAQLKKELSDMETEMVRCRDPGVIRNRLNRLLSNLSGEG